MEKVIFLFIAVKLLWNNLYKALYRLMWRNLILCVPQCSICGRFEEVQEDCSWRQTSRPVPGSESGPQQPVQPGPGRMSFPSQKRLYIERLIIWAPDWWCVFLSQDLPNNMIHQVPIKSLPQEWLWCETWCDETSKKKAKTIDLVSQMLYAHNGCEFLVWFFMFVCLSVLNTLYLSVLVQ